MNLGRVYDHRYHAGNVGDVLKHVALFALLDALDDTEPRLFVETHAGAGRYPLASTGEWTEGVGKLVDLDAGAAPRPVTAWLEAVRGVGKGRYPGSPLIWLSRLGERDRLILVELVDDTRAELAVAVGSDPRIELRAGDGLAQLERGFDREPTMVLIDPAYADRGEWPAVARQLAAAAAAMPRTRFALWYPVKSHSRPNTLIADLERGGVAATAIELITSPLTSKKNRLNGSGVILIRPPSAALVALTAATAWLGPRMAISNGWWSSRTVGWGGS